MSSSSSSNNTAAELVGLRFNPTEQELVSHYLNNKLQGKDSHFPVISCCKHEPWDLLALLVPNEDMEGYFFSPRDYKYAKSKRSNRATLKGSWKITGKPRGIKDRYTQDVIGYKKTLTFSIGRGSNAQNTNFVMHEYDMPGHNGDFVLCRLKIKPHKSAKKKDSSICEEADPDSYIAADDMIAEQDKKLEDPLLPNGNVGECKEKDSFLIDENDNGFSSDLDMYVKQLYPQQGESQESLILPTQPHQQQDYSSSTLHSPKEAHMGHVPHADVNNGEFSLGKSPLGDISTNDNHEPVSDTSNLGSATDNCIPKVFTQPGKNLDPLLQGYPLLSPMHTEPRDVLHGNNNIAGNESQSQFIDCDFFLTDFLFIDGQYCYSCQEKTKFPSMDFNQPRSLGTQPPSNDSFQGYSALATGETPV